MLKKILYCLLVVIVSSRELFLKSPSSVCWKYQCLSEGLGQTCIYPEASTKTYLLSKCDESLPNPYCDFSDMSANVTCSSYPTTSVSQSYPGEPCLTTSNCLYGTCINKFCFSKVLNSICTENSECNPGLRCNKNICKPLLVDGESCINDYDCELASGCNKGICTKYLSVIPGDAVSDCQTGDSSSLFCESFSCYYDTTSHNATCISPFQSLNVPIECNSYQECIGTSKIGEITVTKTTSCDCGMNADGKKYCFPQDGEEVAITFRKNWKKFINSGLMHRCNTVRRFDQECFDLSAYTSKYAKMMNAYHSYFYYPELVDSSECTRFITYKPNYTGSYLLSLAIYLKKENIIKWVKEFDKDLFGTIFTKLTDLFGNTLFSIIATYEIPYFASLFIYYQVVGEYPEALTRLAIKSILMAGFVYFIFSILPIT